VCVFRDSIKRLNHPLVGDPELDQETMNLPNESGLGVVVYSALPNTATEDGLKLLARWCATTGQELEHRIRVYRAQGRRAVRLACA
jgi:hypothetical protein